MIRLILGVLLTHFGIEAVVAQSLSDRSGDLDALPEVPPGFKIEFAAREPLVRNPCAMAFDVAGRLCVGMGPQYRTPKPDTPGDSVFIMIDEDDDGRFDSKKQFATGFNSIQSIAWRGRDLWIANAPDLTVVRDLDGDDVADEYVRVFTDLGNLEHGLHGLNWGPDGRLYMSKGNSKGLSQPGRIAPKPFRDLWGVTAPEGSPDFPPPVKTSASDYERAYHDPADDWGREGGVLVCDDTGENLEIVSRGFRNPWDIAYDSGFNWQGTDNDQTEGDRVFTPFFGAHYGWGHPWSAHWTGKDHPPTAPITGPVFHGSGTGIVFYDAKQFPEKYRGVWFFNDWLRRTVFFYRPVWDGALTQPAGGQWQEFITGGKSLFKPTDIEVGPDGSLFILGWGRAYGAEIDKNGKHSNEGRIFQVSWGEQAKTALDSKFGRPLDAWSLDELTDEFSSPIPARRIDVQNELLRRHERASVESIFERFDFRTEEIARQTWLLWTIGRLYMESEELDRRLGRIAIDDSLSVNLRVQALRILGHRIRASDDWRELPDIVTQLVDDADPRIRLAAVQAFQRATQKQWARPLLRLLSEETDRVVFYAAWQTLRKLLPVEQRLPLLTDPRPGVRRAALLSLAEDRTLDDRDAERLLADDDDQTRQIAVMWLSRKSATAFLTVNPPPGDFEGQIDVEASTTLKPADIRVTTDGTVPSTSSRRWSGKLKLSESATLRVLVFVDSKAMGPVATLSYRRMSKTELAGRAGVVSASARSGNAYQVVNAGLANGNVVYNDRSYRFVDVPTALNGALLVQTSNDDAGSTGSDFLQIETVLPMTVLVGHDTRIRIPPKWLIDGGSGFRKVKQSVRTSDATFELYERRFDAGLISIGGNTPDGDPGGKSNYLVILKPEPLPKLSIPTTVSQSMSLMKNANAERGRAIYYATGGVGCSRCHRADGKGTSFGPDLAHLVQKRDPAHIVKSILDPNADIKEGFATQTIVTTEGRAFSGLLRKETAEVVTLALADKPDVTVPVAKIAERFSQKVSAMPNFNTLLKPQDVVDLTAWLLSRKDVRATDDVAARSLATTLARVNSDGEAKESRREGHSPAAAEFSFDEKKDRLVVKLNGHEFATYLHRHKELTRPAWVHVYSTSGVRLTRNFPPKPDEDMGAADHKFMHPGIWISFGHLDGEDYWRLTSRTRHVEFAEKPWATPGRAGFSVRNEYLRKDGKSVVCEELTEYSLIATADGVVMLVDAEFRSDEHDFYFGDQEESGLAFRMESKLKVQNGTGTILNSRGDRNGAAAWGKEAEWVDFSGTEAGRRLGLFVVPGPDNARRCWMHTRDYGLVAVNPFPKQPKERREPYVKTVVKKGTPYRLSYGLLLHDHPEDAKPDRKRMFEDVSRLMKGSRKK